MLGLKTKKRTYCETDYICPTCGNMVVYRKSEVSKMYNETKWFIEVFCIKDLREDSNKRAHLHIDFDYFCFLGRSESIKDAVDDFMKQHKIRR